MMQARLPKLLEDLICYDSVDDGSSNGPSVWSRVVLA